MSHLEEDRAIAGYTDLGLFSDLYIRKKGKCICKLAQLAIARLKIFKDLKGFSGRTTARLLMIAYLSPQSSYYEGVGKIGNKRKDAKEVFLPASPEVKDDDGDGGDVEGTSNDSHRK